jgi:hypothetical protein
VARYILIPMARGWFANLSDADVAYLGGTSLALLFVLVALLTLLWRRCSKAQARIYDAEPAHAAEYDTLRVFVHAHDQEVRPQLLCEARLVGSRCPLPYALFELTAHRFSLAHVQAELEVQTDAWNSYEELRELVVDAVPNMFRATDELTLEYQNTHARWTRVKLRTPVDTVKAARGARITVAPPSKSPRR